MSPSHVRASAPSPLLALACLAVVHRLRPAWVAVPLRQAAAQEAVSAERLSRLGSRAIEPFERALSMLTRRGRPSVDRPDRAQAAEVAILRALLDVARELIVFVPRRRACVRALLVGAWLRLSAAHPSLTRTRFCRTLGLSERTMRHWLAQPAVQSTTTDPPPPPDESTDAPRARPPRRPRFGFDVVLPDTQHAADTTNLRAFGVPLKLLAIQDVGGRDQDLFDAVIVDDHESAELVTKLVEAACAELPGAQLLTDQGTPYMAELSAEMLEALEIEHAPNKEADPIGKSTVERAFLSIKSIAASLLAVSNELAGCIPTLKDPVLAKATATVLLTALMRAYQAGARAARRALVARGALDPAALARAAQEQRQQARSDDRSSRLILARIHDAYALPGSMKSFVNHFRRYRPAVLLDAEKRFATQAHRDDIRDRSSYFAAIVRRVDEEHRRDRTRQKLEHDERLRRRRDQLRYDEQAAHWHAHPLDWLRDALDAVAAQWLPQRRALLFGTRGIGHAWAARAISRIIELHAPTAAADLVAALLRDWSGHNLDRLGPDGVLAVLAVIQPYLDAIPTPRDELDCAARFASAILGSTGPPSRPAPPTPLRI